MADIQAMFFHKRIPLKSRLSLDFLYTDHGYQLTQKVAGKLHLLRNSHRKPAGRMVAGFDDLNQEESSSLNIAGLVEKFMESQTDLFQFVLDYKFPERAGDLTFEKRISLYVGITIDYDTQLTFPGTFGFMDFINEKKQKQRVGYAIVKANTKQRTAKQPTKEVATS